MKSEKNSNVAQIIWKGISWELEMKKSNFKKMNEINFEQQKPFLNLLRFSG